MSFQTWRAYRKFERAVLLSRRYFRTPEQESFLESVLATSAPRQTTIEANKILYRSQLGHSWQVVKDNVDEAIEEPGPHPAERMLPLQHGASEGRANPKGIPFIYLSTEKNTALAEVRPWMGAYASVGTFRTVREMRVMNCTLHEQGWKYYFKEPPPDERVDAVWADMDRAFSRPVAQNDKVADYAPTQVLAEFFRASGFDGIAYRSNLGEGINIALFDRVAVELVKCELFETSSIKFSFKEAGQAFYRRAKSPKEA